MKKSLRKLAAVLAAAVISSSALAASSSALTLCIGGKCYTISVPSSCNFSFLNSCTKPIVTVTKPTTDCTNGNCGTTSAPKTDCTDGNCGNTSVSPAVPAGGGSVSSDVADVLSLVNSARSQNGLASLTLSSELCAAAEIRAKEIVKTFSHTRPNGTSCFTVLKDNGITYRAAGENIAYGQRSASAVMNSWMNSKGHRANILSRNFGKIGIACYTVNGVKYWVQLFTN